MKRKLSVILAISVMAVSLSAAGPGARAAELSSAESTQITEAASAAETSENEKAETVPEAGSEDETNAEEVTVQDGGGSAEQENSEEADTGSSAGDGSEEEASAESSTQEAPETEVSGESADSGTSDENSAPSEGATASGAEETQTGEAQESGTADTAQDTETAAETEPGTEAEVITIEEFPADEIGVEVQKVAARSVDKDDSGNILHFYLYGEMVKGDWAKISIGGKKYSFYFDEKGNPKTGWKTVDGGVRYFADYRYPSAPRGAMLTGFKTISGKRYYLGTDGIRKTGFKTVNGNRYYMADYRYPSVSRGVVLTGIRTIDGKAYFMSASGVIRTGWVKTNGGLWGYYTASGPAGKAGWKQKGSSWFYLRKNGQAKYGWLKLSSSSIFYLDKAQGGKMLSGPSKVGSRLYFFDDEGRRATTEGWKSYDGDYYYTYGNGTVAVNTTVGGFDVDRNGKADMTAMDLKAQNYSSSTSYLILVNKSEHRVGIYREDGDTWLPLRKFSCGDGKSSTPTIEGSFTVGIKMLYFDSGSARCWYATQFCGNYLFHSVLYYQASGPYDVMDGRLGQGVSHGCVRLQIDNAKWIYNNIPRGTKVVVYR